MLQPLAASGTCPEAPGNTQQHTHTCDVAISYLRSCLHAAVASVPWRSLLLLMHTTLTAKPLPNRYQRSLRPRSPELILRRACWHAGFHAQQHASTPAPAAAHFAACAAADAAGQPFICYATSWVYGLQHLCHRSTPAEITERKCTGKQHAQWPGCKAGRAAAVCERQQKPRKDGCAHHLHTACLHKRQAREHTHQQTHTPHTHTPEK